MDPELVKLRRFMQEKVFQFLAQKQPQPSEIPQSRIIDLVKRLEEGLFRTAASKEEYLNLDTLESRLHVFINRARSQLTSAPLGNIIPTPGMPQLGNTNPVYSSVDESSVSAGDHQPLENWAELMKAIEEKNDS